MKQRYFSFLQIFQANQNNGKMVKGKENIMQWMRLNNTPFWKLFNAAKTMRFSESPQEETLTIEGSINLLSERLELLGGGQFFIEAWETKGQTKERKQALFEIAGASGEISAIGALPAQSLNVREEVQKALEDYKKDLKIETLEARCKELEGLNKILQAQNDSAERRIVNKLLPFTDLFLNEKPGTMAKIAGEGGDQTKAGDAQLRLETAFDKWSDVEPECVEIVEKIAGMAVNDKDTYAMARSILLK
jgi:hypothetical protein